MSLWHGRWKEKNCKFLSKYCTFDENKLFIRVKSIERWVLDALRREKKNGKGFSLQWYSSEKKWSLLYFKKGNFQHKIEEENPSTLTTLRKDYCLVWFEVFSQTINTSTDIRYHIGRMQTVIGLYSYLRVGITSATKKMQVNLQKRLRHRCFLVNLRFFSACSFIKNETALMLYYGF